MSHGAASGSSHDGLGHDPELEEQSSTLSSSSSTHRDDTEKNSAMMTETKPEADEEGRQEEASEEEVENVRLRDPEEEGAGTSPGGKEPAEGFMARVLTRTSSRKHFDPGPPPDGGLQAWIAAACTHLVIMDTWGTINSFGTFETYYTELLNRPPSDVAWIGSFQVFLLFFIGTFTGRLTDAGYFRHLLAAGSILQLIGIFTTAQATQYWHFFLSQGIVMGLGNGCLFCPSLATLSTYFDKRRSLAIGVAAAGSATGGLVFPSVVRQLLPQLGFPWTMRIIGFIQLATLLVVNIGLRSRLPPRVSSKIVEWSAFKEPAYAFYAAGSFFCFWGVYVVFFYAASFSRDIIGLSYTDSLNLLLIINGVGAVGRLLPNYIADRIGVINMYLTFCSITGVAALSWIAVKDTTGVYVWCVFYGIAAGAIQSLFPAGLTSLNSRDLSKVGVRIGMVFTTNSIATLTGPPIAGQLITADNGKYLGAQLFTGTALVIGSCFIVCAKIAVGRSTGKGWKARV